LKTKPISNGLTSPFIFLIPSFFNYFGIATGVHMFEFIPSIDLAIIVGVPLNFDILIFPVCPSDLQFVASPIIVHFLNVTQKSGAQKAKLRARVHRASGRAPVPTGFAFLIGADFRGLSAEFRGKRFTLLWRGKSDC
jgi:hypothetical protein